MTNPTLRLLLLVLAAAAVTACSEVDCTTPQRYDDAAASKRLTVPEGLQAPLVRDTHTLPPGPPTRGSTGGACLAKPPHLVEVPKDAD